MAVKIRPVRPGDEVALHGLICELAEHQGEPLAVEGTAQDLARVLFEGSDSPSGSPALYGHVAELDGQIVGMALWFLNYSTWRGRHGIYLEDLYVRPNCRGTGIGRSLLAVLARICIDRGFGRLELQVANWNTSAIDFYRGLQAFPMDEWTVYRLTGEALDELGASAPAPSP